MFLNTSSIVGPVVPCVVLISIIPCFFIAIAIVSVLYAMATAYYCATKARASQT
jgi:ABC-type multidrug transport system permease subunit